MKTIELSNMASADLSTMDLAEGWLLGLELHEEKMRHAQAADMRAKELAKMKNKTALMEEQNKLLEKKVRLEKMKLLVTTKVELFLNFVWDNFESKRARKYYDEIQTLVDLTNEESTELSLRYIDSLIEKYMK